MEDRKYRCFFCGSVFEDSDLEFTFHMEDLDGEGGTESHWEARCPFCGSGTDWFYELDETDETEGPEGPPDYGGEDE